MPLKPRDAVRNGYNDKARARVEAAVATKVARFEAVQKALDAFVEMAVTNHFNTADFQGTSPYPDVVHGRHTASIDVFTEETFAHGSPGGIQDDIKALEVDEREEIVRRLEKSLTDAGFRAVVHFFAEAPLLSLRLSDPDFEELDEVGAAHDRFEERLRAEE